MTILFYIAELIVQQVDSLVDAETEDLNAQLLAQQQIIPADLCTPPGKDLHPMLSEADLINRDKGLEIK
jgi:hypothetical protein